MKPNNHDIDLLGISKIESKDKTKEFINIPEYIAEYFNDMKKIDPLTDERTIQFKKLIEELK